MRTGAQRQEQPNARQVTTVTRIPSREATRSAKVATVGSAQTLTVTPTPMLALLARLAFLVQLAVLASCASTTVDVSGNKSTDGLCQRATETGSTQIVWGTQWRPDQKDVPLREAAAEQGVKEYFAQSRCLPNADVRRIAIEGSASVEQLRQLTMSSGPAVNRVIVIVVRELGPVVKLLSSAAVVEGVTEVLLHISSYSPREPDRQQDFVVHWKNGGPGVVKGVVTLPQDMKAALAAGFEPTGASPR